METQMEKKSLQKICFVCTIPSPIFSIHSVPLPRVSYSPVISSTGALRVRETFPWRTQPTHKKGNTCILTYIPVTLTPRHGAVSKQATIFCTMLRGITKDSKVNLEAEMKYDQNIVEDVRAHGGNTNFCPGQGPQSCRDKSCWRLVNESVLGSR